MIDKIRAIAIIFTIVFIAGIGGEFAVRFLLKGNVAEIMCEYVTKGENK